MDSVRRLRLRSSWIDWLNTSYECSIPEDDSFTILSKKCSVRPIGFQFELRLQEKDAPVTDSYWRVSGEGFLKEPIRHFVISVENTTSGLKQGRRLLSQWLSTHDKAV